MTCLVSLVTNGRDYCDQASADALDFSSCRIASFSFSYMSLLDYTVVYKTAIHVYGARSDTKGGFSTLIGKNVKTATPHLVSFIH